MVSNSLILRVELLDRDYFGYASTGMIGLESHSISHVYQIIIL